MQDIKVLAPPTNVADFRHRLKAVAARLAERGPLVVFTGLDQRAVASIVNGDITISIERGAINALREVAFRTHETIHISIANCNYLPTYMDMVGLLMLCEQSMLGGGDGVTTEK